MANMPITGFTLWLTGLPFSGKRTLARSIKEEIVQRGLKVEMLDGVEIREQLWRGLGFSRLDSDQHVKMIGFICQILTRNNIVAIASAISPYKEARDENRKKIEKYIEVYVKCPIEICKQRDNKGLYKRAEDRLIPHFPGISGPYEETESPEIVLETDQETEKVCVEKVIKLLTERGLLPTTDICTKPSSKDEEKYSIADEEKIKKRLQDLGYL